MTYRELVAHHLQSLKDRGMTNQEIAVQLNLGKGNYVSMLMNLTGTECLLALKRLPLLAKLCGLTPYESALLVLKRAKHHPDSATEMCVETLAWVMTVFNGAKGDYQARKAATV